MEMMELVMEILLQQKRLNIHKNHSKSDTIHKQHLLLWKFKSNNKNSTQKHTQRKMRETKKNINTHLINLRAE